ncbi:MAG: BON domain-containing protein [Acidobacteriales bacterium]|nr:BON domain-containing protein [Terriglobales bacterium]
MRFPTVVLAMAIMLTLTACTQRANDASYKDTVKNALDQADLKDLSVSEDREHNTITLSGKLHSDESKQRAAQIAQSAAPGRVIANEISLEPLGDEHAARKIESNIDDAIEDTYKAALISNHLDKEGVKYDSKNGVLTLKGTVKNSELRDQAVELAKTVPNVGQVVSHLEVHR